MVLYYSFCLLKCKCSDFVIYEDAKDVEIYKIMVIMKATTSFF
jgi:hypothetical protein